MTLSDDQLHTALSLTALVAPFKSNRVNGRTTTPATYEDFLQQAILLVKRLHFGKYQHVPHWVLAAIFILHLVIINIKTEFTCTNVHASNPPDWFLSKESICLLSKHHDCFNQDLPAEPPRDPMDLLDNFFDTPTSQKPTAKAGAIPGITLQKPLAFTTRDAPPSGKSL
ncbi:hypothetical protein K435DRAFT_868611 [Dendrothele bispora CBS 962.96]|uniref:Uncharacterized protein n=1 Tax=Dendrothele bispora (strain CBS 962.96) TaxID=1314807 RepID=A0A4S8LCP0_DENBC|nr:hypothetical protein K435DRAFT_868611 [Dendrothele bispora CBS 962.96]